MRKMFEKECDKRKYEKVNGDYCFHVRDKVYKLCFYNGVISLSSKKNNENQWLMVESQWFGDLEIKNYFRNQFNPFMDYMEEKYCLTEKYQKERVNLISRIEKETNKSILGDYDLEDFVVKVYNMGKNAGMPFC